MWATLTASQFETFFFVYQGNGYVNQLGQVMFWVYANFLGVGLVLGMMGLVHNYRVEKPRLIFLGLIFLCNLLFFASYGAPDTWHMIVVSHVVWSIWMADGLCLLMNSLEKSFPLELRKRFPGILGQRLSGVPWEKLSLVLPITALWVNFSYADLSSFTHFRDNYPRIMESFEPNALVFAYWPDSSPMLYLIQVEKLRRDVEIIDRFVISMEDEVRLIESAAPHRPVYIFGESRIALPHLKFQAVPALKGSAFKGYKVIPPD
jgi:hypothetical protein